MTRLIAIIILVSGFATAVAEDRPLWLRHPAISPDGGTIAFGYQGNLYRVATEGGTAFPLTVYDGHDFRPVWSRDGRQLAFASDRFGNFDVYVMPAEGGEARRLTVNSADDYPTDFSPDGSTVIFSSARGDSASSVQFPSGVLSELYAIGVSGGRPTQLLTTPAEEARFDRSGRRILFQDRKGYEDPWRKHHTSAVTRDIWIYDLDDEAYTRITEFSGEDRYPVFAPGEREIYYLSEAGGTFNVFRAALDDPATATQLTSFENHPVRFLTVSDSGTLCFAWNGEIYVMQPGKQPSRVSIRIFADAQNRTVDTVPVRGGANEMSVSPSGKEVAFVVRGEVYVTSVETKITKRITNTPEQERSIDFSPDGRSIVYAAERNGSWNVFRTSLAREEENYFFNSTTLDEQPVVTTDLDTFQPAYSPDGAEVAYLEERTTLKVINLESGESRTILPGDKNFSYGDGDQYYSWSPDGKWFLVQYLQPEYWISEVGLVAADGQSDVINLTRSGYSDAQPSWMMDGKMMIWVSNRDGLQGHAKTGPAQGDAYGMFFTQKAFDRFKLTKEELDLLKEEEEKAKKKKDKDQDKDEKGKKKDRGKKSEAKDEDDESEKLPEVEIQFDGLQERKTRLTIHSSRLADAVIAEEGEKLIYLARFEKGYDLWVTELRTKETKILAKLGAKGGALELDKEGKYLFMLAGGDLSRIEVSSGDRKSIAVDGEMTLDRAAERAYLFDHAWRQVAKKFYDPTLRGLDWKFLHDEYARFLPHINNNYDFADALGELLGELNASHTGARYRHSASNGDQTASLGMFFDAEYSGAGLKILEVMPRNPILTQESKIAPGMIIEKIDGTPITPEINPDTLLNRKAGKYTLLSLFDSQTGNRWDETVKPLTPSEESRLLYNRWVETRRQTTEDLSEGRIGYVHVRGMNDPSYRVVQEEVLGRFAGKEAIVVDTRFNGGGDLVDDLTIFLSGRKYMDFVPPDKRSIGMEPSRRWTKPSIVIASEGNYSDAHCFPWAYQTLGVGKVIGMPVAGTCTFVWWERLQDSSLVFGIPNMGILDREGRYLENMQLEPDILVNNEPAVVSSGRDQQLERAVKELINELDSR